MTDTHRILKTASGTTRNAYCVVDAAGRQVWPENPSYRTTLAKCEAFVARAATPDYMTPNPRPVSGAITGDQWGAFS